MHAKELSQSVQRFSENESVTERIFYGNNEFSLFFLQTTKDELTAYLNEINQQQLIDAAELIVAAKKKEGACACDWHR